LLVHLPSAKMAALEKALLAEEMAERQRDK
jgi:hypothetical protein